MLFYIHLLVNLLDTRQNTQKCASSFTCRSIDGADWMSGSRMVSTADDPTKST
jgi:hypothetical protein